MTAALCAVSQSCSDSSGPAMRLRPTAYASTGTATVLAASSVKTTTDHDVLPAGQVAAGDRRAGGDAHQQVLRVHRRQQHSPRPAAWPAVKLSIADIHFGSAGSDPGFGRPRHCRAASRAAARPSPSLTQDAAVDGSPLLPRSACRPAAGTAVVAPAIPTSQPSRNPALVPPAFGASSIRMTAMIGMGRSPPRPPAAAGRR